MHRATTVEEIAGLQLIGREVWAQPVIGDAIRGELIEVRGDTGVIVLCQERDGDGHIVVLPVGDGHGDAGIEHLWAATPDAF
jgi:hypothetical protein